MRIAHTSPIACATSTNTMISAITRSSAPGRAEAATSACLASARASRGPPPATLRRRRLPAGATAPHTATRSSASDDRRSSSCWPAFPFGERDRHLDDPEPAAVRPARRGRPGSSSPATATDVEVDLVEDRQPVGAVAAGRVRIGMPSAMRTYRLPVRESSSRCDRPVDDLAARHLAGTEHHVGVAERVEQPRQLLRGVRAVGVHLHDHVVVVLGAPSRTRRCRRRRGPAFPGRCSTCTARVGGGELVGDRRRCRRGCCRRRSRTSTSGTAPRTRRR